MHRIDGPGATPNDLFTEGSPTGGVPATVVTANWLNDLQENVCQVIEGAGLTLTKGKYDQLLLAIQQIAGDTELPLIANSANGYVRIPCRTSGGAEVMLTINWLTVSTSNSSNALLPQAYSAFHLACCPAQIVEGDPQYFFAQVFDVTLGGFSCALYTGSPGSGPVASAARPVKYLSVGI